MIALSGMAAVAIAPGSNDAGSGGDAGDNAAAALAIAGGTHAAALTPPGDRLDYYAFHADAGKLITLAQTSGGAIHLRVFRPDPEQVACGETCGRFSSTVDSGESFTFAAPLGGLWMLVAYPVVENRFQLLPYTFDLSVDDALVGHAAVSEDAWNVLEATATTPGARTGYVEIETPDIYSKPAVNTNTHTFSAAILFEYEVAPDPAGWYLVYIQGQGTGYEVRTSAAPGTTTEVPLQVQQGRGNSQPFWFFLNEPGRVRITTFHTGLAPRVTLAFGADAPTELRTASGDGTIAITDKDLPATVAAPGVLVAPERTFTHDVAGEGRFVGVFRTPTGATGTTGTAWRPDGTQVTPFPGCGCVLSADAEPGTWTFRVGPIHRAGPSQWEYLAGAVVPRLGLY